MERIDTISLLFVSPRMYIRPVKSSLTTKLLAFALLLAITFPHHLRGGVVLCMAESGHVELESAGSDCCASQPAAAVAMAEHQDAEDHCGWCNDILLSSVAVRSRATANAGVSDIDHTFGPYPWLGPNISLAGQADGARFDQTSIHAVETRLALRTFPTVIRC